MSKEEIAKERERLLSSLNPSLVEFIRSKRSHVYSSNAASTSNQPNSSFSQLSQGEPMDETSQIE